MDPELNAACVDRDWPGFVEQVQRFGLAAPTRDRLNLYVPWTSPESDDDFVAWLRCDGYDATAPLLQFVDPDDWAVAGRRWWPSIPNATMNSISFEGNTIPIICTPGTRGYHLHQSHRGEAYERSVWALPKVATLLGRLFCRWGACQGRLG